MTYPRVIADTGTDGQWACDMTEWRWVDQASRQWEGFVVFNPRIRLAPRWLPGTCIYPMPSGGKGGPIGDPPPLWP